MLKIYLAGPDVFLPNAIEQGKKKKAICKQYGFEGLYPLDNQIPVWEENELDTANDIFSGNIKLIRQANIIVANLTPFRGPSADVGTVWECGFGFALNKDIYGYTNHPMLYSDRVKMWSGYTYEDETRDKDNNLIENFGLIDNLMVDFSLRNSVRSLNCDGFVNIEDLTVFEELMVALKRIYS